MNERDADGGMPPATMLLRLERRFDDVVADPGAPSWCWTMVKAKRIFIGTIVAAALLQGDVGSAVAGCNVLRIGNRIGRVSGTAPLVRPIGT